MKRYGQSKGGMNLSLFILSGVVVILFCAEVQAQSETRYGIGTGISMQSRDGDLGFDFNGQAVELDVDLTPDEFNDLMQTAFGFGGYVAKGKWSVQYSLGYYELQDDAGSGATSADIEFESTTAEVTVGYMVFRRVHLIAGVHGGARYTKHELDTELNIGNTRFTSDVDEDWTDALVGFSLDVPFWERWVWNNRFNAGFGGSDGTYFAQTGINWRFHNRWSAGINGKITAVEFENGSKGDSDWYLYDVDETAFGISFLFHW